MRKLGVNKKTNSSNSIVQQQGDHFLVGGSLSPLRMESLLVEWANTSTEYPVGAKRPFTPLEKNLIARSDAAILLLIKRYPELFSSLPPAEPPPQEAESKVPSSHWEIIARVQLFLRLAWDAPDIRHREWHIFKARDEYFHDTVLAPLFEARMKRHIGSSEDDLKKAITGMDDEEFSVRQAPPPLTLFEKVFFHFHRIADSAHHCQNPECPAPYFFGKKGRKYCTTTCAAPSRKEQNRRWWRDNRGRGKNGGKK